MWASHSGGFSCRRAQALGSQAPVVAARGLSIGSSWALEYRLHRCGMQASVAPRHVGSSGPGITPTSPALAGGLFSAVPPGKSNNAINVFQSGESKMILLSLSGFRGSSTPGGPEGREKFTWAPCQHRAGGPGSDQQTFRVVCPENNCRTTCPSCVFKLISKVMSQV